MCRSFVMLLGTPDCDMLKQVYLVLRAPLLPLICRPSIICWRKEEKLFKNTVSW